MFSHVCLGHSIPTLLYIIDLKETPQKLTVREGLLAMFAIPCLLFLAIAHLDLSASFDPRLLGSFYSMTCSKVPLVFLQRTSKKSSTFLGPLNDRRGPSFDILRAGFSGEENAVP